MSASDIRLICAASSATAPQDTPGNVLISGSYGGEYNAWHAARRGIRGVVLNDAGVGHGGAGINGLAYLDRIGLPAATADAMTCHIGDAEDMLARGIVSHVNAAARALGCAPGQTVRACAEAMRAAPVITTEPPPIAGGQRHVLLDDGAGPAVIAVDAAPMLVDQDAGKIAVTGSHAALFRGKPDGLIAPDLVAVFFSDAGVGLDGAGIARLALLDQRAMIAATAAAMSAPIGNAREIWRLGILSHVNATAAAHGARPGMALRDFVLQVRRDLAARGGAR